MKEFNENNVVEDYEPGVYTFKVLEINTEPATGKTVAVLGTQDGRKKTQNILDFNIADFLLAFKKNTLQGCIGECADIEIVQNGQWVNFRFPMSPLPVGDYLVRIAEVEEGVSKTTDLPMLTIKLDVSGTSKKLMSWIVENEWYDNSIAKLNKAFKLGIKGPLNIGSWVGKVATATVSHNEYKGEIKANVSFFSEHNGTVWSEPASSAKAPAVSNTAPATTQQDDIDDEVPF